MGQLVAENSFADFVSAEAEHAVSDMPGVTGCALSARVVAPKSQRRMEPVAVLELMAAQVLATVVRALQPSVATAGRAPGMPFKSNRRRKLEEALAGPYRRAVGRQNLRAGKMAEQRHRRLGRRGH